MPVSRNAPFYVNGGTSSATYNVTTDRVGAAYGDLIVVAVETAVQTFNIPAGWTPIGSPPSTGSTTTGTRLYLIYKWWLHVGSAEEEFTMNDPGDHWCAMQMAFRGVHLDFPFDAAPSNATGVGSSHTGAALDTAHTGSLLVTVIADPTDAAGTRLSSASNPSLSGLSFDSGGITSGNGGGISVISGNKDVPGAAGQNVGEFISSRVSVSTTFALRAADGVAPEPSSIIMPSIIWH